MPTCEQCGKSMNPIDYIVGPVCHKCCQRNQKAAMGGNNEVRRFVQGNSRDPRKREV